MNTTAGRAAGSVLPLLLLLQVAAGGQESPASSPSPPPAAPAAVAEPEYEGVFALLAPETGVLTPLERVDGSVKERSGGGLSMQRFVLLPGGPSPVRAASGRPEIVLRVPSQSKDPLDLIGLFPVEVKGNTRAFPFAKRKLSGAVERLPSARLPIEAEKYGSSSFRIRPASPLRPGEYCFLSELSRFFFCFGVD